VKTHPSISGPGLDFHTPPRAVPSGRRLGQMLTSLALARGCFLCVITRETGAGCVGAMEVAF
jgi:hypothetical protein